MFFVIPQLWIAPAIAAAAVAFGPVDAPDIHIKYRNLPAQSAGAALLPDTILMDKRSRGEWPREKAQCVIAHEYGHLAGRKHSKNRRSLMYPVLTYPVCHRWLIRHGIR